MSLWSAVGPPSLLGPLMAHEADEGRALDDAGGGGRAQQSVEGGEALGRSGPPRRTSVTTVGAATQDVGHDASWPPETRQAPLLVRQEGLFLGGEALIVSLEGACC